MLAFENILSMNLIAIYPDIAAAIIPAISGTVSTLFAKPLPEEIISYPSLTAAPSIAGMDIRNENLRANSLFKPREIAPAIVNPERDTAGNIATPCAIPITTASAYVVLLIHLLLLFVLSA